MKDQSTKELEFRFRFFSGLILCIFAVLLMRLWYLQIIQGNERLRMSRMNQSREIKIPAPRGVIYDRDGRVLASSRISHMISVAPDDVLKNQRVIQTLARLLQMKQEDLVTLIKDKRKNSVNLSDYVAILTDVDPKTVGRILEAQLDLPGVQVDDYPVRYYPRGEWAAHLFGYIGEINKEELKAKGDKYRMGDLIGKTGLEKAYEDDLRGKDGSRILEVDRLGHTLGVLGERESYPGNNLRLSIDAELQDTAEQALREHLAWLRQNSNYKNARSGAVIAMDPRNGRILAMVSYPGFDPNIFVGNTRGRNVGALFTDPLHPFTNRATQGEFMPGSTFKPITVMAALGEGKADANARFGCTGYDRIYGSKFKCWNVKTKPGGHGRQNLVESLQNSCNMVMAELARLVGPEDLAKYARLFGLGSKTGFNLSPGESSGVVGDPEWKAQRFKRDPKWYPLETLHYSIGQGYITVTPLQLANMYSAIANGGKLYTPQVVEAVTNPEGKIIRQYRPKLNKIIPIEQEHLALVREGLEKVISVGTARSYFTGFPLDKYPIAGKTGTAQNQGKDDFALFASFAPVNNPELVVVVVIEEGGSGGLAGAPIARKIYETYFKIQPKEKAGAKLTNTQGQATTGHNSGQSRTAPQNAPPTAADPTRGTSGSMGETNSINGENKQNP